MSTFLSPSILSRTSTGRPYCKSNKHVWQTFFSLAHVWQTSVFLNRPLPAFHRKTVNGLVQILHSAPNEFLSILMYGFSPRQVSQRMGNSLTSQPKARLQSLTFEYLASQHQSEFLDLVLLQPFFEIRLLNVVLIVDNLFHQSKLMISPIGSTLRVQPQLS